MEIGVFTFGETRLGPDGSQEGAGERLRNLIEEVELADRVGLDVYGVGEHHRPDYAVSAPAVVLAAAAACTERIRLTPTVSVLSSDDPVRVFQQYATLDLLSAGRAEIMVGRGSFTESFPLFGYELEHYHELFDEKLDLLLKLREETIVEWQGTHRPSIPGRGVYPRPEQDLLPLWVAVGGTPQSVVRAATLGLPMALAIIGGMPERFTQMTDLYRRAWARAGRDPADARLSINSHGFIAEDADEAADLAWPAFSEVMNRIGRERGWPEQTRRRFEVERGPRGALFVGDPDQIVEKILWEHELFGHDRFMLQLTVGSLPHDRVLHAIELLGTEVAPRVRAELSTGTA